MLIKPAGSQFEHRLACPYLETGSLGFLLYLPAGYPGAGGWPVVYHLHGGGEGEQQKGEGPLTSGGLNTLAAVKAHGLPALAEGAGGPYVLVSPQSPKGSGGWGSELGLRALEDLAEVNEGGAAIRPRPAPLCIANPYGWWSAGPVVDASRE